ncbi:hypothetical protein R1sor_010873 [Riccia sorocarpa]|uniref:Glutathione hydrolase n=1 Tax=Riccia sorocarpa TaxID=122646 RepID=A0ABD3HZB0_9MARC
MVSATCRRTLLALVLQLVFLQLVANVRCLEGDPADQLIRPRKVEADVGAVAADHRICSDLGVGLLKKGGHAVDAAVGAAFCQGVVNPGASGIGGGDFLILRLADGTAEAYDMRETAPGLSSEDMYAKNRTGKTLGGLAAGVPGELAGLYMVWRKYGKLPWKQLVYPTIRLCVNGFAVEPYLANEILTNQAAILADEGLRTNFAPNGNLLKAGDICYRKQLGKTLAQIAKHGPKVFYRGAVGKRLVADIQAAGGIMTFDDLQKYKVKVRKPLVADTWGLTVLGMPPPSSGGAGLILILNILAAYKNISAIEGDLGVHHIVEAFKHTYAVRMNLADPDFVNVNPVLKDMLSPAFAATLQKTISDTTTQPPQFYGGRWNQLEDHGTSHISVVDADRNAVSITATINYSFGSKFLSTSTGILVNNEMDDFVTPTDNTTNAFPPAPVNFIRPYKRPLSTMSPTIILEKGQLRAVLGGSGGIKILTTVAQVLLRHIAGDDPLEAVSLPRVHHQLEPNWVSYENFTNVRGEHIEVPAKTRESLLQKGHELRSANQAVCQLIVHDLSKPVSPVHNKHGGVFLGKLTAVSDLRKDGYPAAY